jgi:hypothetical protein
VLDSQAAQTRRDILAAAHAGFVERGYTGATSPASPGRPVSSWRGSTAPSAARRPCSRRSWRRRSPAGRHAPRFLPMGGLRSRRSSPRPTHAGSSSAVPPPSLASTPGWARCCASSPRRLPRTLSLARQPGSRKANGWRAWAASPNSSPTVAPSDPDLMSTRPATCSGHSTPTPSTNCWSFSADGRPSATATGSPMRSLGSSCETGRLIPQNPSGAAGGGGHVPPPPAMQVRRRFQPSPSGFHRFAVGPCVGGGVG